jgi:hypothetical protein
LRHFIGHQAAPSEGYLAVIAEMATESDKRGLELISRRIWIENMRKYYPGSVTDSDIKEVKSLLKERFSPRSRSWRQKAIEEGLRSLQSGLEGLQDPAWRDG